MEHAHLPVPTTGAALVESHRAVAEAIAARRVALANPRDPRKALDLIMNDCASLDLAEEATYEYARGGSDITGASIRLLEVIARRWGNIECGVKELGRGNGYSDVLTYAIDLESGFQDKKEFQVRHWRDTKSGGYAVTGERDIYEVVANLGARRKRACLEAIIPSEIKDRAKKACEDTLKSKIEITPEVIKNILTAFDKYNVTQQMIEKRIQRNLAALTPGHVIQLRRIVVSLKENMGQVSDWFEVTGTDHPAPSGSEPKGQTQTDKAADELATLASRKREDPPAKAEPKPQPPKQPETAFEETGEITNASVRKAIDAAGSQEALQPLLYDIMKLQPGPERDETMTLWNKRVMGLKTGAFAKAEAPAAGVGGKVKGTAKIKADLLARLNKAKNEAQLNDVADDIASHEWTPEEKQELEGRYAQCKDDLL